MFDERIGVRGHSEIGRLIVHDDALAPVAQRIVLCVRVAAERFQLSNQRLKLLHLTLIATVNVYAC